MNESTLKIFFDRYNVKYNRLWNQVTTFFIFFLATLIGYYLFQCNLDLQILKGQITFDELSIQRKALVLYSIILTVLAMLIAYVFSEIRTTKNILKAVFDYKKIFFI